MLFSRAPRPRSRPRARRCPCTARRSAPPASGTRDAPPKRTQRLGVVEHLLEEGDVEVVEPLAATDLFLQVERARQALLFVLVHHRRQPGLGPIQIRFVHPGLLLGLRLS